MEQKRTKKKGGTSFIVSGGAGCGTRGRKRCVTVGRSAKQKPVTSFPTELVHVCPEESSLTGKLGRLVLGTSKELGRR